MKLEITNEIVKNRSVEKNKNLENKQKKFIKTGIGKVLNKAIDLGIKSILPDLIEDQVIEIKNTLIEGGLKEGLEQGWNDLKAVFETLFGKDKNKFNRSKEIRMLTKRGGYIDQFSKLLNKAIDKGVSTGKIDKSLGKIIKSGKTTMLRTYSNELEASVTKQLDNYDKIIVQKNKWIEKYNNKDLKGMENSMTKINKLYTQLMPFQKLLDDLNEMKLIQEYVKSTNNFNLSKNQIELLKKVI